MKISVRFLLQILPSFFLSIKKVDDKLIIFDRSIVGRQIEIDELRAFESIDRLLRPWFLNVGSKSGRDQ